MADPLSIVGAVAAIIQISSTVVNLIKSVKDASSDRQKLVAEINATTALCQTLMDYAEMDAEPWAKTFQTLCATSNGPVEQFQGSLEYLQKVLAPGRKGSPSHQSHSDQQQSTRRLHITSWVQLLKWPFTEGEVRKILTDIGRQRSLFNLALTNDNVRLATTIRTEVGSISKGVNAIRMNQEGEKRNASLSKLSSIDFQETHADVSSRRAQRTGQWLLDSKEYKSWLETSPGTTLWCSGIPGAGKTTLFSLILDHLVSLKKNHASTGVAGIYCSYRDPQTTMSMLGSILQQLAGSLADVPPSVSEVGSTKDASEALSDVISSFEQSYIVIDALDECANRLELLAGIRNILPTNSNSDLRILVTSRSGIADIERNLKADIQLEIRSNDNDVRVYLEQSLRSQEPLSDWISASPGFGVSIIEAILPRLSGMLLLARLYVDLLAYIPTKRGVRKALERLPEGTDCTYAEAWERICAQKPDQAEVGKRVLSWIVCASRPLRVQELRYGLAVEAGDEELDPDSLLDIGSLTSFCAGLVIVDEHSRTLSLVHPTTSEYFVKRKGVLLPTADDKIAVACITYLLMDTFQTEGACSTPDVFDQRHRESQLLGYAAVNWGSHARVSGSRVSLDLSLRLLKCEQARSAAFQALVLNCLGGYKNLPEWPTISDIETGAIERWFKSSQKSVGALHLASYFGLIDLADVLLCDESKVDELDGMGGTALHWAILGNQNDMLKFLLESGASTDVCRDSLENDLRRWSPWRPVDFSFPLHIASCLGNTTAIKLLLSYQAAVDSYSADINAYAAAAHHHQIGAAVLLLAHGGSIRI